MPAPGGNGSGSGRDVRSIQVRREWLGKDAGMEGLGKLHRLDAPASLWWLEFSRYANLRTGSTVSREPARAALARPVIGSVRERPCRRRHGEVGRSVREEGSL